MNGEFVREQIEEALQVLAALAADQREYLEERRLPPSVDELALALEDFIPMLPALVREGSLSPAAASAVQAVSNCLGSFSGKQHEALWRVESLSSASEWQAVRALARNALHALRGEAG